MELYLHSLICLHGMVLSLRESTGTTLPLHLHLLHFHVSLIPGTDTTTAAVAAAATAASIVYLDTVVADI